MSLTATPGVLPRVRRKVAFGAVAIAVAFLCVIAFIMFFPDLVATRSPFATNFKAILKPPSLAHPFGTDALGRDVFSRTLHGARYSVLIGLGSVALSFVLALPLGVAAGAGGRRLEEVIMRGLDVIGAFPDLLLAILIIALLGPGIGNLIVAMGIAFVPKFARVVRVQTRAVTVSGYVQHARTLGQKRIRTLFRHIIPNALGALPVLATIGLGHAVIGAASLSFLGLGPRPPTPEWGLMLSEAIRTLRTAWWVGVFPGLMITLLVVALTVVGKALQGRYERR